MLENKNNRTELKELGEFGLIKHLASLVQIKNPETLKGIGDDAAVLNLADGKTVITTDMLLEGVHFDLSYVPLKHLGYKAVMVNLSDVFAMNAKPKQILVSIGLSNRFSLEAVEELYSGMLMACEKHGVDLVGGDTSSSHSGMVISITALGMAKEQDIVYRKGANENDLICVSGDLGGAYMGLQVLLREKSVFMENPKIQPDLSGNDYILERQLKPEARADVVAMFASLGVKPSSMIDISDGLASEVLHLCNASDLGAVLFEEKILVDFQTEERAKEFGLDPTVCALNGGEDYELLFTIPLTEFEKIKSEKRVSVIGHMTSKSSGYQLISRQGTSVPLVAQGWNAFTSDR